VRSFWGVKIGGENDDWDRMASKRLKMEMPRFYASVYNESRIAQPILDKIFAYRFEENREFKY